MIFFFATNMSRSFGKKEFHGFIYYMPNFYKKTAQKLNFEPFDSIAKQAFIFSQ